MRRPTAVVAAALLGLALASPANAALAGDSPGSAATVRSLFPSGEGLTVRSVEQVRPRLWHLVLSTAALPKPTNLYVLLPVGYDPAATRRYPVLWLMPGAQSAASDWSGSIGQGEKTIGDRQVITVMPDITLNTSGSGWCTDWADGTQQWEKYHIGQLLPWVDAHLRTLPTRDQRSIVGVSEGGFCSMTYAARHPDLFGQAVSFSGVVETWQNAPVVRPAALGTVVWFEAIDGLSPNAVFGDPVRNAENWVARDPGMLAGNLHNTRLSLYAGNGAPGALSTGGPLVVPTGVSEAFAQLDNQIFQQRLASLNIPVHTVFYGQGTHQWPYFARDLAWSIDDIMDGFAAATPAPTQFQYTSGDASYGIYGWSVAVTRTAAELSTLRVRDHSGFDLSGTGSSVVTTAPLYTPGASYAVRIAGDNAAAGTQVVTADAVGRLQVPVLLGPANSVAQDLAEAVAPTEGLAGRYTSTVTITAS